MRIGCWNVFVFAIAAGVIGDLRAADAPRMLTPNVTGSTRLCSDDGPACVIVAPQGANDRHGQAVARAVIGKRAVAPRLLSPDEALDPQGPRLRAELMGRPVIVLGNINTNRAVLPFYARFQSFADADYPGSGAYAIRTAYRPWGTAVNAVIIEATDDEGLTAGVTRFAAILATLPTAGVLDFPYTLESKGARPLQGIAKASDKRVDPRKASADGYAYAVTGEQHLVRRTLANLRATSDAGGKGFPYSDYGLGGPARAWTLVYPSPHLSDAERQEIDQRFLDYLVAQQNAYWRGRSAARIGSRHQTMGTWAFYTVVKHLRQRANPDPPARVMLDKWYAECRAYLDFFSSTWHDDCEGIPTYHAIQPAIHYALEEGKGQFLYGKPLRSAVHRALAVTDNMGFYCGTGTYEEARPGTLKARIALGYPAAVATYCYRDPTMKWLWETFCGRGSGLWTPVSQYGLHLFATGDTVGNTPPADLLGILVSRFDEQLYKRMPTKSTSWVRDVPYERTFDKLAFRQSYDRLDQYLVIEGKQYTGADNLPPLDANAILRFADRGQVWLHSNSMLSGNFHRSAIWVTAGEDGGPRPTVSELLFQRATKRTGLVRSRLASYNGSTWDRTIFWLVGQGFAVIDSVRAERAAEQVVACTWRSPAHPNLTAKGWEARVGNSRFALLNADPGIRMSSRFEGLEGGAETTLLRQFRSGRVEPGDETFFRNFLYAGDQDKPRDFSVRPLGQASMLVRNERTGEIHLLAVRVDKEPIPHGVLQADCDALCLGPVDAMAAGDGAVSVAGAAVLTATGALAQPEAVRALLASLWQEAAPVTRPAPPAGRLGGLKPAWRFAGAARKGEAVTGCAVSVQPELHVGRAEELADSLSPLWTGSAGWGGDVKPTITLELPVETEVGEIEIRTGFVVGKNTRPDETKLKPLPACQATFLAEDGTVSGKAALDWQPGYNAEQLHKAEFFAIGRQRARGFAHRAKRIVLAFDGPVRVKEIIPRSTRLAPARVTRLLTHDLDGDGTEEILIASADNELIVLSEAGKERWRRRFNGPINAVHCAGLGPGREATVLVATLESWVHALTPGGDELWRADTLFLGGDCPGPFSIATWRPQVDGALEIIVGNYNRCSFFDVAGKRLGWSRNAGAFQTMTLGGGMDLNNDGCEDALMYNNWRTLSIIDGKERKMVGTIGCPGGLGLALERIDGGVGDLRVLIATDTGVGVLRPRTKTYDFRLDMSPISSCIRADLDGDGQREIIIGRLDGFVMVLNEQGKILSRTAIGEPVRDVVCVPGPTPRLLAACDSTTRLLSPTLHELGSSPTPKLAKLLAHPLGIIAVGTDGSLSMLR
jgi:hypothetical protein